MSEPAESVQEKLDEITRSAAEQINAFRHMVGLDSVNDSWKEYPDELCPQPATPGPRYQSPPRAIRGVTLPMQPECLPMPVPGRHPPPSFPGLPSPPHRPLEEFDPCYVTQSGRPERPPGHYYAELNEDISPYNTPTSPFSPTSPDLCDPLVDVTPPRSPSPEPFIDDRQYFRAAHRSVPRTPSMAPTATHHWEETGQGRWEACYDAMSPIEELSPTDCPPPSRGVRFTPSTHQCAPGNGRSPSAGSATTFNSSLPCTCPQRSTQEISAELCAQTRARISKRCEGETGETLERALERDRHSG